MEQYFGYASGMIWKTECLSGSNPTENLAIMDLMDFMRDHLEGTPLDMTKDAGAGRLWPPLSLASSYLDLLKDDYEACILQ